MHAAQRLRSDLDSVLDGRATGVAAADALCRACVDLLGVDGAAISYTSGDSGVGTYASSGELSQRLDGYQFSLGEGPCFEVIATRRPVLVPDLTSGGQRWPAFTKALLGEDIHAVFAMPVNGERAPLGALDLFRAQPGPLTADRLEGMTHAARLAASPLLQAVKADPARPLPAERTGSGQDDLTSIERVEVYQATGMLMGQLDCGPDVALARLRAHALANDQTASDVAWAVVRRTLVFRDASAGAGA